MSPHAVPSVHHSSPRPDPDWAAAFNITRHAFLPATRPLAALSSPYYQPWESIATNLPALLSVPDALRSAVRRLPLLSTAHLAADEAEWRRAYAMLAFIAHAHIWAGPVPDPVLPPQVTVPFLAVSAHVELPPVLTYAAANLWNFTTVDDNNNDDDDDDDFTDPEKLRLCFSFTGTESESWFLLISVAMEARAGGGVLPAAADALDCARRGDRAGAARGLAALRRCVDDVARLLARMPERCDPLVFYRRVRPFLAGSLGMADAGLPNGVFYDEGPDCDGGGRRGSWRRYRGGSNGQSSLIQIFDLVLGVKHPASSFHHDVREYMPGPHRRFLLHLERIGSVRDLVLATPPSPDPAPALAPVGKEEEESFHHHHHHQLPKQLLQQPLPPLQAAYVAATDALTAFRQTHINIVTRYIIIPSREKSCQAEEQGKEDGSGRMLSSSSSSSPQNLASASTAVCHDHQLVGTGGTALVPFLRKVRDDTALAGKLLEWTESKA